MLGYIIGAKCIKANPDKTKAMMSMAEPTIKKEVQKLIGIIAALNRFISKSIECNISFFKVLRGGDSVKWGLEQSDAFRKLKNYMTMKLILNALGTEAP